MKLELAHPGQSLHVLRVLIPIYIEDVHNPFEAIQRGGGSCIAAALMAKSLEENNGRLFRHSNDFGERGDRVMTHYGCLVPRAELVVQVLELKKGPVATSAARYGLYSDRGQSSTLLRRLIAEPATLGPIFRESGAGVERVKTSIEIADSTELLDHVGCTEGGISELGDLASEKFLAKAL